MKIYVAGPISGQSYEQVLTRYERQTASLQSAGYDVLHPMTGKRYLRNEIQFKARGYDSPVSTNHAIKNRDRWMVGQADVLLLDFTTSGDRVSIGTCMELAWADELNKHTVAILPKDNIHNHAFVLECCDIIFELEEDAMVYLNDLVRKQV